MTIQGFIYCVIVLLFGLSIGYAVGFEDHEKKFNEYIHKIFGLEWD